LAAPDVLVIGAGPAGAIAGLVAARAGARVRIVDRATFPRDKLCGDTVNPGALAILARLGLADEIEARSLRVDGMIVTGAHGDRIVGRYPRGLHGRAIVRRDLDWILLRAAIAAGCELETGVNVRRVTMREERGRPAVAGIVAMTRGGERTLTAPVVVGADGRRTTIGFGLGLARHPARPRRWAVGAYFEGVPPDQESRIDHRRSGDQEALDLLASCETKPPDLASFGEMHVRAHGYIGVAPVPGGATNVCLVKPSHSADEELRDPAALLRRALAADPLLRDRFASARLVSPPVVLGPLAVDVAPHAIDGLILAGDAAGFIDPMTGDGLRFAIRGGELAGGAALRALAGGWADVHDELRAARAASFGGKWRFNRALRALVGSPGAIGAAALGARLAPAVLRAVIARAGDCDRAA
jgi:flavin-dependent dehydrogenase